MKINYLLGTLVFSAVMVFCAFAGSNKASTDFDLARQEIVLRSIGHEILLHAGDKISRVLPVKKINDHEYQLQFENPFTFQSDTLVSIVTKALAADQIAADYVVNVVDCSTTQIVFGYAISRLKKNDLVPCSGRPQPKNCYYINLKFRDTALTTGQKGWLVSGALLLALAGFLLFRTALRQKKERAAASATPAPAASAAIRFGNTMFDPGKRSLVMNGAMVELTPKENKLLLILAQSPNEVVERSRLQKEVWEDEGVIVGRSLDMFVSKLRKKLEQDPSVQLVNIHGKGYKLEVDTTY